MKTPFIRRVTIRNYKSIAASQVDLQPLMFLVGPNGSGKSNFLDALRFVADSLRTSLDHALRDRGTIKVVRRRSGGHPNHFALRLDFELPDGSAGHYSFRIGAKPSGGYEIQNEECRIAPGAALECIHHYHVRSGRVVNSSLSRMPASLPAGSSASGRGIGASGIPPGLRCPLRDRGIQPEPWGNRLDAETRSG